MATRMSPGKNAPMNMSPALAETTSNSDGIVISPVAALYSAFRVVLAMSAAAASWSARMMSTTDGGMICPSVPEAQIVPVASGRE